MNLLIPAHRIFEPLALRKTQRRFNLRAHVRFADSLIQVGHEDDGGNLLNQSAVLCLHVQQRRFGSFSETSQFSSASIDEFGDGQTVAAKKHFSQFLQSSFSASDRLLRFAGLRSVGCALSLAQFACFRKSERPSLNLWRYSATAYTNRFRDRDRALPGDRASLLAATLSTKVPYSATPA